MMFLTCTVRHDYNFASLTVCNVNVISGETNFNWFLHRVHIQQLRLSGILSLSKHHCLLLVYTYPANYPIPSYYQHYPLANDMERLNSSISPATICIYNIDHISGGRGEGVVKVSKSNVMLVLGKQHTNSEP